MFKYEMDLVPRYHASGYVLRRPTDPGATTGAACAVCGTYDFHNPATGRINGINIAWMVCNSCGGRHHQFCGFRQPLLTAYKDEWKCAGCLMTD